MHFKLCVSLIEATIAILHLWHIVFFSADRVAHHSIFCVDQSYLWNTVVFEERELLGGLDKLVVAPQVNARVSYHGVQIDVWSEG